MHEKIEAMKTMGLMAVMAVIICGCDKHEASGIRQEAHREIAENKVKEMKEEWLTADYKRAREKVFEARRMVSSARTANDLALAEDDLREARKEMERIEAELEEISPWAKKK